MKTYVVKFIGRLKGAIGITYTIKQVIEAPTAEQAIKRLYEKWEHIRVLKLHEMEDGTI